MSKKTIVITGGGTGGHIYPGLAIADELKKTHPEYQVHFVGAIGGLEEKIWPKYEYPYHFIKIGRLHSSVGVVQQLKTLLRMPLSLFHAVSIFLKIKPSVVLGVGGFASGPFLLISWLLGAKTALWEANAHPGLTNRWLSRIVGTSFVVFGEAAALLPASNVIESGMPVRDDFFKPAILEPSPRLRVLVFGGSQGARAINEVIVSMIKKHPRMFQDVHIKHQTGGRDFERMQSLYGMDQNKIDLVDYIHDMPSELKKYDVVVCRSGASTVAEVIACRKPAVFIPLPTAADNHQYKNALVVSDKKAGVVIEQKNLNEDSLHNLLMDLHKNRERLTEMSHNLQQFDFSRASQKIVNSLLEGTV